MARDYNYDEVEIRDVPREDYTFGERRKEIMETMLESGGPGAINQTQLGEVYGVSQQQISLDLDRINEFMEEKLGNRIWLETESAYSKIFYELMEQGNYSQAWRVHESLHKILERRGKLDNHASQNINVTQHEKPDETESYVVIEDDAQIEGEVVSTPENGEEAGDEEPEETENADEAEEEAE